MTAYKIVCVDDEPLALRYLTSLLKEINPQNIIKTFSSSLEALEYLKNNRPDIVFLDIDMPHLNGIELARTLRRKSLACFGRMMTTTPAITKS